MRHVESSLQASDLYISVHYRQHKLYNKELYADFIAAQIKTLSFLAYIIRIYQVICWFEFDLLLKSIKVGLILLVWLLNGCVCALGQDLVGKYSQQMVKGMLQLLSNCPPETAHLRKELLIAAKHILTTDLRSRKCSLSVHRNSNSHSHFACTFSAFFIFYFLLPLHEQSMPKICINC